MIVDQGNEVFAKNVEDARLEVRRKDQLRACYRELTAFTGGAYHL